jgi:hypothetical protein
MPNSGAKSLKNVGRNLDLRSESRCALRLRSVHLVVSTEVAVARSRRIFWGYKIHSMPSFGGEVKPSVPCRRFAACKLCLTVIFTISIIQGVPLPTKPDSFFKNKFSTNEDIAQQLAALQTHSSSFPNYECTAVQISLQYLHWFWNY